MMSNDELRQQHDTINTIAKQVATIIKWWPLVACAGSLVIAIGTLAIAGYKYDDNLVKKDEYAKMIRAVERISAKQTSDSTYAHQGLSTTNKRIDSLSETIDPNKKLRVKYVTATQNKNGVVDFHPLN